MATPVTPPLQPDPFARLRRSALILRLCLWAYVVYIFYKMGLWQPITYPGVDYDKHWFAARALLEGKTMYIGGSLWMGFNYPQAAALPFFWLGFFKVKTAEYLWKATLLALTLACWWMAYRYFRPCPRHGGTRPIDAVRAAVGRHWLLTTAFMTSCFFALTSCLYIGNIDAVNAFYAVAMVSAVLSGAPLAAGIFWAMLTLVKMMPLALILPVILWRQWRLLHGFMLTMLAYFLILVALGRVGDEWFFAREAIPMIPVWWRFISISPVSFLVRLCGHDALIDNPQAFLVVTRWGEAVMLVLYGLLLAGMARRRFDWTRALEGAIVFYPIFSPLLEYHHFVWIMPVFFLQARRFVQGDLSPRLAGALVFAWLLLNSTYHIIDLAPKTTRWLHFTGLAGYMLVLTLTLVSLFQARGTERGEEITDLELQISDERLIAQ